MRAHAAEHLAHHMPACRAPLENHHLAASFLLMRQPEYNFMADMTKVGACGWQRTVRFSAAPVSVRACLLFSAPAAPPALLPRLAA